MASGLRDSASQEFSLLTPLRSAHTRGLVVATSPCNLSPKNLQGGTGRSGLSHELFTRSVLRNKSQGLVPKIQTSLNSWMGLVPATSPFVCVDL